MRSRRSRFACVTKPENPVPAGPWKYLVVGCGLAALLVVLGATCTTAPTTSGGTDTGNGAVAMLYNPDGTAAVGATVRVFRADENPAPGLGKTAAAVDSTMTDANGRYSVAVPAEGRYNVLGAGGGNLSYLSSVLLGTGDDTIPRDTLRAPGSISGVVRLRYAPPDSNLAYVLVFGTNTFTQTTGAGDFALSTMAEGTYRVRIITTVPDYAPMDTALPVVAGRDSVMGDTLWLTYMGIPVVENLRLSYDTLRQIVTLTWEPCDPNLVQGYQVYRRQNSIDSAFNNIAVLAGSDTVYNDAHLVQGRTYLYSVRAADANGNEGPFGASVENTALSAFTLEGRYGSGPGSEDGQFSGLMGIAIGDSGNVYCSDFGNRRIQRFGPAGQFLSAWGELGQDTGQFAAPKDIAVDSLGFVYVADTDNDRIEKFGRDGTFIEQWGATGTGNGQFQEPHAIVYWRGFLYVGEWEGKRVQKFTTSGSSVQTIATGYLVSALAVCDSGLFLLDDGKRIVRLDPEGSPGDTIFRAGKMPDGINDVQVNSLCILPSANTLCLSNLSERKVQALDYQGGLLFQFALSGDVGGVPEDLAVSAEEKILVGRYDGYFEVYVSR